METIPQDNSVVNGIESALARWQDDTHPCKECGVLHTSPRIVRLCPDCFEKAQSADHEKIERERIAEALFEWKRICPSEYQKTEETRLHPKLRALSEKWRMKDGRGVGIIGDAGLTKTRTVFCLLKRVFTGRYNSERRNLLLYLPATKLSWAASRQFDVDDRTEARALLKSAKDTSILFIDDLAKERATAIVCKEIYDIIEYRTSRGRPIFWTSNFTGQKLVDKFAGDGGHGEPIVRRLREFCDVLEVWNR